MAALLQTPLKSNPAYRQMTVEEFLEAELQGRAELDDGVLYMMSGGSFRHARISANLITALTSKLRGSACVPVGPDFAVRTGPANLRLPDVSVYCDIPPSEEAERAKLLGDPRIVFEVLSSSTRKLDLEVKLPEYCALRGIDAIVFADPDSDRARVVQRTGPEAWSDQWLPTGAEVPLRALGISLTADEIFARD